MNIRREGDRSSERDRSMDRLLRQALRGDSASGVPGSCLDAETLAAWVDGGLAGRELATAEAHVAACSRCQASVAVLVKHQPVVPVAEPAWRPYWGLGWLIPLTAGAAAVLLWFALPTGERPGVSEPGLVQTQTAASQTPQEPQLASPRQPSAAAGEQRQVTADNGQRAPNQELDKEAKLEAANTPRREDLRREARQSQTTQGRTSVDALGKLGDETPAAPPAAAVPSPAPPVAAAAPAARAPAAARAAESAGNVAAPRSALSRQVASAPAEVASPDPSIRWRIGAAGSIQYSSNGGSTWEALSTGVVADLTAGTSPSPSVCWVVGRAGTVLLTTDGRRWHRLAFPEAADLVAVEATDARTATVTTADGRKLRSVDGGASWK